MNLFTFVSAAVLVLAAGDALAQNQTIADGQTIRGRIDRNERLPGGEKAGDCYRFALDAPAEVTVVQRSRAFDSYVYVFEDEACEGFQRHEDDDGDGDGGRNARLSAS